MAANQQERTAPRADHQLVDLVRTALVDPNIHTDTRMQICNQIVELLRTHGSASSAAPRPHAAPHRFAYEQLPDVLESVLTDPNLHTDTRARLHWEIRELLAAHAVEDRH